jgi:hypothetical protein
VLVHLDHLAGVNQGQGQARCVVPGQFGPDRMLLADQDDLQAQVAGGRNGTVDRHGWSMVTTHCVDDNLHRLSLLPHCAMAFDRTPIRLKRHAHQACFWA